MAIKVKLSGVGRIWILSEASILLISCYSISSLRLPLLLSWT